VSLSILQDARLYEVLHRLDVDLAQTARVSGCRQCGGVLHGPRRDGDPRPHRHPHALLGSVAERTVRLAPCPVLTVKGDS
jgi:hypothetical protein